MFGRRMLGALVAAVGLACSISTTSFLVGNGKVEVRVPQESLGRAVSAMTVAGAPSNGASFEASGFVATPEADGRVVLRADLRARDGARTGRGTVTATASLSHRGSTIVLSSVLIVSVDVATAEQAAAAQRARAGRTLPTRNPVAATRTLAESVRPSVSAAFRRALEGVTVGRIATDSLAPGALERLDLRSVRSEDGEIVMTLDPLDGASRAVATAMAILGLFHLAFGSILALARGRPGGAVGDFLALLDGPPATDAPSRPAEAHAAA